MQNEAHVDAALEAMDAAPPGVLGSIREAAKKIGRGIIPVILFLAENKDLAAKFYADIQAGNVTQAVEDLAEAWRRIHPTAQ